MKEDRARPKRKAIPRRVKLDVLDRQLYCCAECKDPFSIEAKIQYDHRPALEQRQVNRAWTDYTPPQLDPDFIDVLHVSCHLRRTVGRAPGAEKTVTIKGSDAWLAAKFRKLEGKNKPKPRQTITPRGFAKIPSRPFPKRLVR
jgi:5-methylcytosine-specific restriction endonuclease McrA